MDGALVGGLGILAAGSCYVLGVTLVELAAATTVN